MHKSRRCMRTSPGVEKAEKREKCGGGWWYRRRCLILHRRRRRRRDQKRRKDRTSPPSTARGVRERRRAEKARGATGVEQVERAKEEELRKGEADWRLTGGCLSRRQIVKTKPESQWIVTTRPLYHLQQPVSYSSRLQVIYNSGSVNCDRTSSCGMRAVAAPEL